MSDTDLIVGAIPPDAQKVLAEMRDGWGYPISYISADAGVDYKRTRDLMRAFYALGWADRHPFFSEDDGLVRGSGYSRSPLGARIVDAFAQPKPETPND